MPLNPQWLLIAAGILALLVYLVVSAWRTHQMRRRHQIEAYGRPPAVHVGRMAGQRFWETAAAVQLPPWPVDDLTWIDLDMDDVFGRINSCQSALGDIRLYMALRSLLPDIELADRRKTLAELFGRNEALRQKVGYHLAGLGRWTGTGLERGPYQPQSLALPRAWRFRLLGLAPLLGLPLLFLWPGGGLTWLLGWMAANFILTVAVKSKYEERFRTVRYIAAALACGGRLAGLLETELPRQAQQLRRAAKPFGQLRRSNALLSFNDACERTGWPDPSACFLLPLLSFAKTARRLPGHGQDLLLLYETLGEMDLALCIASLRQSLPAWCVPAFGPVAQLQAEGLYHPLLQQAVPNNLALSQDLLLTGSNASGKSTFIKAVALNCILAQSLHTCTARSFCMGRGRVASSMAVADDILTGDSYFVAEIKSMRRLLYSQGEGPAWYFVDEVLKGTNTVERVAAAAALLRGLQKEDVRWIAATHDLELVHILGNYCANAHFTESLGEQGVSFDYKLHPGPATSRNALLLLQRTGFPEDVVSWAQQLVAGFEASGEWAALP